MKRLINWIKKKLGLKHKVGTLKPKRGHKVFEFNYVLKELNEVLPIDGKVKTKPGCIYVSALNKRNAAKKILKHYQ